MTELSSISVAVKTSPDLQTAEEMYIDLLKRSLTRALFAREWERHTIRPGRRLLRWFNLLVQTSLTSLNLELVRLIPSGPEDYLESGHAATNRVEDAETMLGTRQFDQMQSCIDDVVDRRVPGDVLEAGVWRGGMTIFMRAVLRVRRDTQRRVWAADSFTGLPNPDIKFNTFGWKASEMAVSLEEVKKE